MYNNKSSLIMQIKATKKLPFKIFSSFKLNFKIYNYWKSWIKYKKIKLKIGWSKNCFKMLHLFFFIKYKKYFCNKLNSKKID